jgi:hypothetical protein
MDAPKSFKENLIKTKSLNALCQFAKDLHTLEFAILKNPTKKFLVVDYGVR